MSYVFLWDVLGCMRFSCQRFGTLCLFHLHRRCHTSYPLAYEDGTGCSETLATKLHTPENIPKENIRQVMSIRLVFRSHEFIHGRQSEMPLQCSNAWPHPPRLRVNMRRSSHKYDLCSILYRCKESVADIIEVPVYFKLCSLWLPQMLRDARQFSLSRIRYSEWCLPFANFLDRLKRGATILTIIQTAIDGIAPHDILTEDETRACAVNRKNQATVFCDKKCILGNFQSMEKTVNHYCYIETLTLRSRNTRLWQVCSTRKVQEKLPLHGNAWR
jgi:hypothetical protein